jgi:dienelactone hydrolase
LVEVAAIAFVCDRDEVDPDRVGVVGASCGGSVAVVAAALEPRVRYVVSSAASPIQLLPEPKRDLVLDVISGWVAQHARSADRGERIREG